MALKNLLTLFFKSFSIFVVLLSFAACDSILKTEATATSLYNDLVLRIQVNRPESACLKAGESVLIHFEVVNRGDRAVTLESSAKPVMDLVVDESPGLSIISEWSAENPDKVQRRIEWQPNDTKGIELVWRVADKGYVPGARAGFTGLLSAESKVVQFVPLGLCLGIPFEPR